MPEGSSDLIDDPSNTNRTVLKVIDTNKAEPIKGRVAYNDTTGLIKVTVTYNKFGINKIMLDNTTELSMTNTNGIITATTEGISLETKTYKITIIDNKGSKKELEATAIFQIYAKLYKDGTLAFTSTDRTIEGKELRISYGDISKKEGTGANRLPWLNENLRTEITTVDIVDGIAPISTEYWFFGFSHLEEIKNINNLDTSNVNNMSNMFASCNYLTELDLSNFDTSNVTDMTSMFSYCTSLTELDLSSFDTSKVTNMYQMFYESPSLIELDLSNFNTRNVTNMVRMFGNCYSLVKLNVSNFNTSNNETDMSQMFVNCRSLTELDLSKFNTINATSMSAMFSGCSSLTELDLSSFNTSNVIAMDSMFYGCSSLTELDLSSFNTSNVKNMNNMFRNCSNLKTIYVGENWKLGDWTTYMFNGCGTNATTKK